MSFRSTIASPTFTPALNVLSTTAPVFTFRSLVRTKAPPFPGFTCWNSTTWKSMPSRSRVMPFFRSFVETLIGLELDQLAGREAQHPRAVSRDLHRVLDPDTPDAREVDAGFDRHQRALRKDVFAAAAERWTLVDLETHSVAQAVG